MRKLKCGKWISSLLMILMVTALLFPASALAAPDRFTVNGQDILTAPDNTVQCGEGTAVYDPATKTLTLTNATIDQADENDNIFASLNSDLTIVVVGNNTVGGENAVSQGNTIYSRKGLLVTGSGTLNVYGMGACFTTIGDLIIDGVTVNMHGLEDFAMGANPNEANLIVRNGAKIRSERCLALYAAEGYDITISDSTVIGTGGDEDNIICSHGNLSIKNSKIEGTSGYPAIFSAGNTTIEDSDVKATSVNDWGIWSKGDLSLKGTVNIVSQGTSGAIGAAGRITFAPKEGKFIEAKAGASEGEASFIKESPLISETDLSYLSNEDIKYFATTAHKHDFSRVTVDEAYKVSDATCTEAAVYHYSCSCGMAGTETFTVGEPLGHNYGEWVETKPATATEAGSREKVCSVCGDKVVEAIPVTPDIPQTGDTSNMDIYGLLLLLSGVGVVGGVVYNSRKVCSK